MNGCLHPKSENKSKYICPFNPDYNTFNNSSITSSINNSGFPEVSLFTNLVKNFQKTEAKLYTSIFDNFFLGREGDFFRQIRDRPMEFSRKVLKNSIERSL